MSLDAITNAVTNAFADARRWRGTCTFGGASIDTWFDRTYRMYHGIHHPEEIAREQKNSGVDLRNVAYYPFGRLKVDAARIFIDGTYSHAIDAPFVLEPTRNPKLNDSQKGDVAVDVARLLSKMLAETGLDYADAWNQSSKKPKTDSVAKWLQAQSEKMSSTYNEKAIELANVACEYRKNYIADQLDAGGWIDAWGIITHNLMAEPYTALCARENKSVVTQEWHGTKVKRVVKTIPTFRAIDPRNLYLSPDATSAQDGKGVTELTIRSRSDLVAMFKSDDPSIIKTGVMKALTKIQADGMENLWLDMPNGQTIGQYQTHSLVYQGLFSGKELADAGYTGYDRNDYHNATVEICHGELIRFDVLPYEHNLRNYYTAQHTKTSSSYAGESILTKLYHVQNQLNTAVFLRDRNLYMSSGSSYVIHSGYFNRVQDFNPSPYARNMASIDTSGIPRGGVDQLKTEAQYIQHDNHIESLKRQGDEISGVVSGLSGLGRSGVTRTTATGAVLDQTSGERMMNAAVLNLDRSLIEPMVQHLDADNMQWNEIPKHYMRGDVVVRGKGINGLREVELKGRLLSEALPMAMQLNQAGKVPDELLQDATKGYFDSKGLNTSSIPSRASQQEFTNAGLNPPQRNDGRMFNPQQSMTGV